MSKVKTYHLNILESGTVTSTPVADSDFPVYRLRDRDIGRMYKTGSVVNPTIIHADQGVSGNQEADALIIPAGHNLNSLTLTLQHSPDDSNWTTAVTWTQSGSTVVEQSFTAQTKRYWRLSIASPSAAPQLAEMFLTKGYQWDRNPEEPDRENYPVFNVQRYEDTSGKPRYLELGDAKEFRGYSLYYITGTHREEVAALNSAWGGSKPFWMKDVDAALMYGELMEPITFVRNGPYATTPFKFLEVLP